ncbi:gamma-glutamyl-gamma-aminobutyrate hydrolase family protein [Kitasatospora sp. NPDC056531]|uniref:gamma-glutamyl-gamma-aminobutyrate hydrolase family protein n=1 Tax=Kitasatospora sp. NPDC056531 TaxID=3345856 RepID=UPI00369A5A27
MAARAADGTIEAIGSTRHRFAVGVQGHPEMGFDSAVMHALVAVARSAANARPDGASERPACTGRSPRAVASTPVS